MEEIIVQKKLTFLQKNLYVENVLQNYNIMYIL